MKPSIIYLISLAIVSASIAGLNFNIYSGGLAFGIGLMGFAVIKAAIK